MPKVSSKHLSEVKIPTYYFPTYNPGLYYTHYHLLQLQHKNREIDVMHVGMRFSAIFKVFQEPRGWWVFGFVVGCFFVLVWLFWWFWLFFCLFFLKPLQKPVT